VSSHDGRILSLERKLEDLRRQLRAVEALARQAKQQGLIGADSGSGRSVLWFATNDASSFAVNTSRTLDLYNRSSTVKVDNATVYNPTFGAAVPSSKKIIVGLIDDAWCVLGYVC
jgi:hypothetical protein